MSKSIKLEEDIYWDSTSITHNQTLLSELISTLNSQIASLNTNITTLSNNMLTKYPNNKEVATNEYFNGKRVYAKRLVFTDEISGDTGYLRKAHGISSFSELWIDTGNSYMSATGSHSVPIPALSYNSSLSDRASIEWDSEYIYFYTDTGWGTRWTKYILLKYTK